MCQTCGRYTETFTELLSHEHVNREVLHWLKAWDGVVFKRAPPKPAANMRYGGGGGGRGGGGGGGGGGVGGGDASAFSAGGGRGGGRFGGGGGGGNAGRFGGGGGRFGSGGRGGGGGGGGGDGGGSGPSGLATHVPLDVDGRPLHKILLLCGPPVGPLYKCEFSRDP
jgi:hypothetical protein